METNQTDKKRLFNSEVAVTGEFPHHHLGLAETQRQEEEGASFSVGDTEGPAAP